MAQTENSEQGEFSREEHIADLLQWMIQGARPHASGKSIVKEMCERLRAAGVPVDRFGLYIGTLHPNLQGRRFLWKPGEEVEMADAPMGMFSTPDYTSNPVPHVGETGETVRRHLDDPDCPNDYLIVDDLRAQGFTDYIALPLVYVDGDCQICSWASMHPGGFSENDLQVLNDLCGPLARLTETYMLRLNAGNLLSTYVGRNSGEQILSGKIHRGEGEEISAVILFADFEGFTDLSNRIDGRCMVQLLNASFDCLVPPVMAELGEILKFMGDGFFAIFPITPDQPVEDRLNAAMRAVKEGRRALQENDDIEHKLDFRTAIHFGTFHYGNIGGSDRLDFTAIGPAVNLTARLLAAAGTVGCRDAISAPAAGLLPDACRNVGSVEVKGFDGAQSIWEH